MEQLERFSALTLEELQKCKLDSRYDRKFIFSENLLPRVLEQLPHNYRQLRIHEESNHSYVTTYYDTPEYRMYLNHHNGKRPRYKIRKRDYILTSGTFYEIKKRDNKGYLHKYRQHVGFEFTSEMRDQFIEMNTPYNPASLRPTLTNRFKRITLLKECGEEKITFDREIQFENEFGLKALNGLVVAEIKTRELHSRSVLQKILRSFGIYPVPISKYLTGIALLNKDIKKNQLKEKMLHLNQLQRETI